MHSLAPHEDFATAWLHDTGEDLDESGLSRPVVAQQAQNLAAADMHADATQGKHAAIGFLDVPQFDQALIHWNNLSPTAYEAVFGRPVSLQIINAGTSPPGQKRCRHSPG